MTTTEEIIVSGENFIERRIMQFPQRVDIEDLQARAYVRGYKRGRMLGLLMGWRSSEWLQYASGWHSASATALKQVG